MGKVTGLDAMKSLDGTYSRLFNSRDGQTVLADLCRQFYDTPMNDDATLERQVGRRDVVHHINQRVHRNAR